MSPSQNTQEILNGHLVASVIYQKRDVQTKTAQLLVCIVPAGPKVEKSPFVSQYTARISHDNTNNWANLIFIFPQLAIANACEIRC
jgi:hypothetical protein